MGRALLVLNTAADRQKAMHWVTKAPWGARITFQSAKRTVDQNSLMWAALTDVAQQVDHMGQRYTPEAWKILFMHACGREVRFLPGLDGKTFVPWGQSSSDLSKEEMTELIEFIFSWGAEHGVKFNESDEAQSSDKGSGAADPSTSPAAILSAAADQEAGEPEVAHGAATAPASEPIPALTRMILEECVDNMLRDAFSEPAIERPAKVDKLKATFLALPELVDHKRFVETCAETARRVIGKPTEKARAREYLIGRLPA